MFSKQGGKPRKVQDPGEALNPETPGRVHVSFSFLVACGQRWETQQWVRLPVTAAGWLTLTTRLFCQAVVLDLYVMCFPCDCLQDFSLNFGSQQFGSDVFRGFCLSWIWLVFSLILENSCLLYLQGFFCPFLFFWDSNYMYVSLLSHSYSLLFFSSCLCDSYWLTFKFIDSSVVSRLLVSLLKKFFISDPMFVCFYHFHLTVLWFPSF